MSKKLSYSELDISESSRENSRKKDDCKCNQRKEPEVGICINKTPEKERKVSTNWKNFIRPVEGSSDSECSCSECKNSSECSCSECCTSTSEHDGSCSCNSLESSEYTFRNDGVRKKPTKFIKESSLSVGSSVIFSERSEVNSSISVESSTTSSKENNQTEVKTSNISFEDVSTAAENVPSEDVKTVAENIPKEDVKLPESAAKESTSRSSTGKKFMISFDPKDGHQWNEYNSGTTTVHINKKNGPVLHLFRGNTYFFCVKPNSGHSFVLTTSPIGGPKSKLVIGGFEPISKGCVAFEVDRFTPRYFYYQDATNEYSGGLIIVHDQDAKIL